MTQTLSRHELDARHLRRLQRLVSFAYQRVPLYRRLYDEHGFKPRDLTSLEAYQERVPATHKGHFLDDQVERPYGGMVEGALGPVYHFRTTGTTGTPLREGYSNYDAMRLADQWCYALWDAGLRPGDGVFVCFHWGPWVGFWSLYWACQRFGLTVFSGGGMSTSERIAAIHELRPTALAATPTYLVNIAETAREEGAPLEAAGLRVVMGGGEAGLNIPDTRMLVAELYGLPDTGILDLYGIGEVAQEYSQCATKAGGVHVVEDACYTYAADPETRRKVPDGEIGENIITNFTRAGQIFIKYHTKDLIRLHENPGHGCGWTWAFLEGGVLGRTDFVVSLRGVNIYPTAVENLLGRVPGLSKHHEIHVFRDPAGTDMLVKVEADPAVSAHDHDRLGAALQREYRRAFGVRIAVEVLAPKTLPRDEVKGRRFFQHDRRPRRTGRRDDE